MLKSRDIYIDLGTSNTLIYVQGLGLVVNEPTLVAHKNYGQHKAHFQQGYYVKKMLGKVPENIKILSPLTEGVISDLNLAIRMVRNFLKPYQQNYFWNKPRMLISLPYEVTTHEKNAVIELGLASGAGRVDLIEEPFSALIGMGIDVLKPSGQLVLDLGGGTTEVLVLSLGGIVCSSAFREGGEALNRSIVDHLRLNYNFLVGELTAEKLKMELSVLDKKSKSLSEILNDSFDNSSKDLKDLKSLLVSGLDLATGLPARKVITSEMLRKPVEHFADKVILTLRETLNQCPPELASDLKDHGIYLTGGGAHLKGLSAVITSQFGLKTSVSPSALIDVFKGGQRLIEDSGLFDKIKISA